MVTYLSLLGDDRGPGGVGRLGLRHVRVGAGVDEGGDQADRVELREFIRHVCSVQELEQEEEVTTDFVLTIDSTH